MKSILSGPLTLLLFIITSGLTSVIQKHFTYYQFYYTWNEAQSFCNTNGGNLATVYTQSDVNSMDLKEHYVWISMTRCTNWWCWISPDNTKTSVNSNNWADWAGNGLNSNDCASTSFYDKRFYIRNCGDYIFSICGKNEGNVKNYTFITDTKTWSDAQAYCQTNYGYLAIYENSQLSNIFKEHDFPVWIGLHREGGSWMWRTGLSGYVNWTSGEPSGTGDCVSISSLTKRMATQNCDAHFPFVCTWENVFLVKEKKSWEEALKHCRGLTSSKYNNLHFDLLSVDPGEDYVYVRNKIMDADTGEVWTGLRFLANEWLWVNGAEMLYPDLPLCPIPTQHCGAISKDTGRMEARDCSDQNNFLCYSYY